MKKRVLFSASDVGTAQQMIPLIRELKGNTCWETYVCSCGDATRLFKANLIAHREFKNVPAKRESPSSLEKERLVECARQFLTEMEPIITVSGISNFGNGPDEAIIHVANNMGIKTCLLLDDFGPIFSLDGEIANIFLATSQKIFDWCSNYKSEAYLIGSPRHEELTKFPSDAAREKIRKQLGIGEDDLLVSFFAQNDRMLGHNENFTSLCETLDEMRCEMPPFHLVVRPHPGAPSGGENCFKIARSMKLPCLLDNPTNDVLDLLCASDIVLSCISTSLTDYLWLKLGANSLKGYPIYLLMGEEIKKWLAEFLDGPWQPEVYDLCLAYMPRSNAELKEAIRRNLIGAGPKNAPPLETLRVTQNSTSTFSSLIASLTT